MNIFKKTILFALVAALALASLPLVSVLAAGQRDPITPPQSQISNQRLERIWARQLRLYNRFGHVNNFMDRIQRLIDRAQSNGKDVSALQAALDGFEAAVKDVHPIYESMKGIVNSHQGFDENGKVTDPAKALETVKAIHEKIQEIKTGLNGTGKTLRDAIKAYREANPRPQPSATPTSG